MSFKQMSHIEYGFNQQLKEITYIYICVCVFVLIVFEIS